MGGAVHLYQREKVVHLKAGGLLGPVAQDVGQDGLGVRQVFAEGESDGLTGHGGHCAVPLEGHKQSKLVFECTLICQPGRHFKTDMFLLIMCLIVNIMLE